MLRSLKLFCIILAVPVLPFAIVGFADANTMAEQRVGSGSRTISGYTVSNVVYNLGTEDPSVVNSVELTLDAQAALVRIRLEGSSSFWYDCSAISGTRWMCNTSHPAQTVASMDVLEVIASSD